MVVKNLKNLIELFAYLYCLAGLFGKKFKVSIHAVVLAILVMFMMTGLDNYGFPEYTYLFVYIGVFLYGLMCYKESIKLTLVNCVIAYAVLAVMQLLIFFPLYWLFYIKSGQGYTNELLINAVILLTIMMSSHKVSLKRLSNFFMKRDKLIAGVSILILCGLVINFYQMKEEGAILKEIYVQMVYFILIFTFIIYEWQKSRMDAEKKKAQLEMNKLYYDAYDQLIILIRERQHDIKNHINAILSMIYTTDNYEELAEKQKDYCGYVMEQNEKTRLVLSAGNPLIAGFMYSKLQEAESKKIDVEYDIDIRNDNLVVLEYELVEMMGILIDNAMEALTDSDVDTGAENQIRKMYIAIKATDECVEIIVANTSNYYEEDMTERFFEQGYSSKGKGHGIGLPKLKKIVHEKNGDITVSNELHEGMNYLTFTITIIKENRRKS